MPAGPRKLSSSGIYHVVTRGNGRQIIFNDDGDRSTFLNKLVESARPHQVSLLAWCLMDNHVHLLVQDSSNNMSAALQTLLGSYARYFNRKTGHVGHVFQQRFYSEAIETDKQFLAALRYIHVNPERAGMCDAAAYPWSSYREYVEEPRTCNVQLGLELAGGAQAFIELCEAVKVDEVGFEGAYRLSDEEAVAVVVAVCQAHGTVDAAAIKTLPVKKRDLLLRQIVGNGVSVRQAERLTGIGRNTIFRAAHARMSETKSLS